MSIILLKNKMMHYEVLGRGKPLIFLHGWIGSWRYWVPTLQVASANYRAYAVDMQRTALTIQSISRLSFWTAFLTRWELAGLP